jgi:autotransporter translocation and assembly factor TamB
VTGDRNLNGYPIGGGDDGGGEGALTLIVSGTVCAAAQVASPAWLASMMQVPAALKVTVLPDEVPDKVHTPVLLESTERVTGRSERAVAVRGTGSSPTVPELGGSMKVIV